MRGEKLKNGTGMAGNQTCAAPSCGNPVLGESVWVSHFRLVLCQTLDFGWPGKGGQTPKVRSTRRAVPAFGV